MAKEIYLYSPIWSSSAQNLIEAMDEAGDNAEVTIRVCSPGGSPIAAQGILAKMQSRTGKTNIAVDGQADSMALYMLPFATGNVSCLDSTIPMCLHRADMEIENEEDKIILDSVNASLRAKLEKTVNAEMFQKIKGLTFDDVFSMDKRVNVMITPEEAKALGLVKTITSLQPKEAEALKMKIISCYSQERKPIDINTNTNKNSINLNSKPMTADKLKAEHPEVYRSILSEGAKQEKMRIEAHLAFIDVDQDATIKSINEGTEMSPKIMAEMSVKMMTAKTVINLDKDSKVITETGAGASTEKTEAEQKQEAFLGEVKKIRTI